jgi:tRNA U34 5-carboxymethylaminomethyl modifying GTPase MnmE/TrmE
MALQTPNLADTIVALATPPGAGAIGVIRVSGKMRSHSSMLFLKVSN